MKKSKVKFLEDKYPKVLSSVRRRLGLSSDTDASLDDRIERLSNKEIVMSYTAWKLGVSYDWEHPNVVFKDLNNYLQNEADSWGDLLDV